MGRRARQALFQYSMIHDCSRKMEKEHIIMEFGMRYMEFGVYLQVQSIYRCVRYTDIHLKSFGQGFYKTTFEYLGCSGLCVHVDNATSPQDSAYCIRCQLVVFCHSNGLTAAAVGVLSHVSFSVGLFW